MSQERSKTHLLIAGLLAAVSALSFQSARACTMAVVSGKATDDGRPLLWKNRDADSRQNMVQVLMEGKYRLMAVIDAGQPEAIWMGMNEAGLCVANSLSLDLPGGQTEGRGNGRFMKLALEACASVADFENLLRETNQAGRRTRANFGVIDAQGGAVLFEAGHRSFVMFDANDPKTAPHGYVVRSNFAMSQSGAKHREEPAKFLELYSGERYLRAERLVANQLSRRGALDYRFFLQTLSRDVAGTIDDSPGPTKFCGLTEETPLLPASIDTKSTINRRNTVSAVVFHGVKPGNLPRWTTMWTLLGQPAFSVAVPCWITAGAPSACLGGPAQASLCAVASRLREMNYDSQTLLSPRRLGRVWTEILPVENCIIQQTSERMRLWRRNSTFPRPEEVARFQESMAQSALESLLHVQTTICEEPALAEKPNRQEFLAAIPANGDESNSCGE